MFTIAGNGANAFAGDGGPAISASLFTPQGVALDSAGNVLVADTNNSRVRKLTPRSCTYSLSPGVLVAGAGPANSTVGVTTSLGCGWTAISNAAWLAVIGGASGIGNGTVSFSTSLNTSRSAR